MREANRAPVADPCPGKGHRVPQAWGLSPGAWIHTLSQTGEQLSRVERDYVSLSVADWVVLTHQVYRLLQ